MILFQSTHPMRGATYDGEIYGANSEQISIHAPHAGCDYHGQNAFHLLQ